MTRLIEFLISLAIVAALFLIVGIVLPGSRHVSEKVETNRKQSIVFDVVNSFARFDDWSALAARDPAIQLKTSGPESGKGAKVDYTSKEKGIGSGSWTITESTPKEKVAYAIQNNDWGSNKRSVITLKPTGRNNRNVEIRQTYDVDYGFNLLGRYAGLYVNSYMGQDVKVSLRRLTNLLATIPNQDYGLSGSRLTNLQAADIPAEHVLVINSGGVTRADGDIQKAIATMQEWVKRTMESNGLEAAGPMRISTRELARETYNFDVVQPVRKTGATDPAAALSVTPQGPVKYEQLPARRAVKADFTGYFAELDTMRNAMRAWGAVRGMEVAGQSFEVYSGGVDAAFTENGKFEMYWPVK